MSKGINISEQDKNKTIEDIKKGLDKLLEDQTKGGQDIFGDPYKLSGTDRKDYEDGKNMWSGFKESFKEFIEKFASIRSLQDLKSSTDKFFTEQLEKFKAKTAPVGEILGAVKIVIECTYKVAKVMVETAIETAIATGNLASSVKNLAYKVNALGTQQKSTAMSR